MSRKHHLLRNFGITEEQYDGLLRLQDGRCAVCHRHASTFRKRMSLDHDHKTGEIRGILCINCNRYIVGRHRRESGAELLLAAYHYLTGEYTGWIVPERKKRGSKRRRRNNRNTKK